MEKSKATEYIIAYLQENHISAEQIAKETGIPAEKLQEGYKEPLLGDEFLYLCAHLNLRPEDIGNFAAARKDV